MNSSANKALREIYLDWVNNWLSVMEFADHYGLSEKDAINLIDICRNAHEDYAVELFVAASTCKSS